MSEIVKRAPAELANAERPAGDRPPPDPETSPSLPVAQIPEGYWLGAAGRPEAFWRAKYEEECRRHEQTKEALRRALNGGRP